MSNKDRLKKILKAFDSPDEKTLASFKQFDEGVVSLKEALKKNIELNTLDDVKTVLQQFKSSINIEPLIVAINTLKEDLVKVDENFRQQIDTKSKELQKIISDNKLPNPEGKILNLQSEIDLLKTSQRESKELIQKSIIDLNDKLRSSLTAIDSKISDNETLTTSVKESIEQEISDFKKEFSITRIELMTQISNKGGGAKNRRMTINGTDISTRYTDLNFKGSGVTYSASDDNTNKRVDLTLTVSGGTGAVSSVSNSDSTLTISPTTGDVIASLNLAHANTWTTGQLITIPIGGNITGFNITQNDTTNNPIGQLITNAGTGHALSIDQNGDTSASTSVGGAFFLENTGNAGAGMIIYSNHAGSATGRLLNIRADNVLFDQDAVHIDNDGVGDALSITGTALSSNAISISHTGVDHAVTIAYTGSTANKGALNLSSTNASGSTFQVTGAETGVGTIKVTHTGQGDGSDSNAAGLSLQLNTVGTAAQGLFIDTAASYAGKMLNIRSNGAEQFTVSAAGVGTFNGAVVPKTTDGAALGSASLMWSDLFLASGGIINWNNGNYTITHSSGSLAFSGLITTPFNTTSNPHLYFGDGTDANDYGFAFAGGRGMVGYTTNDANANEALVLNAGASKGLDFYVNGTNNSFLTGTLALSILSTGAATFSNSVTVGGKISNVTDPTLAQDAATKNYVDAVAQGLSVKGSVKLATAVALPTNTYLSNVITITATGTLTVDGTVTALGDRILVKDESAQLENGVYTVTTAGAIGVTAVLTRSSDMDTSTEFPGAFVFVESGTVNAAAGFVCTNSAPPTVGTTAITFTQFSGAGEIIAGNGLSKSANTLTIDTAITVDKTTSQTLTNKTFDGTSVGATQTANDNSTKFATTAYADASGVSSGSGSAPLGVKFRPVYAYKTGLSLGTITTLDIFTVPGGVNGFVATGMYFVVDAVTGAAADAVTMGLIESSASKAMTQAGASAATSPFVGMVYGEEPIANSSPYSACLTGNKVQLSITNAQTSTTITGTCYVQGYYY